MLSPAFSIVDGTKTVRYKWYQIFLLRKTWSQGSIYLFRWSSTRIDTYYFKLNQLLNIILGKRKFENLHACFILTIRLIKAVLGTFFVLINGNYLKNTKQPVR